MRPAQVTEVVRLRPKSTWRGIPHHGITVSIGLQSRDASGLSGRRNQEIGMLDGAVVQPALERELLVDLKQRDPFARCRSGSSVVR